ncbi:hypothetical protein D9758_006498 [Tetrapyrgos nigripes]|uniref:acylaminoacyl-peptidase n=1 Tax=Tetrapyrgos nigripes TaxID=182062 RepID=A0A8H5GL69_9AGAR|nr:hypothetical protein D9758_006498 [Tetrapyrgos nigripes]
MSDSVYFDLSEIPVPVSGRFTDHNHIPVIQFNASVKDHTRNVKRTVSKSIFLTGSDSQPASTHFQEVHEIVASGYSHDGNYRAILRETGDKDKKRFVEIWAGDRMEACKEVTDVHGAFYNDDFLSSISFSYKDRTVLYVAEKKTKPSIEKESTEGFSYTPSFGEGLPGKKTPIIFLFNWEKSKLTTLSFPNPSILFGQPIFSPAGNDTIYATGYEFTHEGRLLGIKFCFNRPFGIWEIKLPSDSQLDAADDDQKASPCALECKLRKLTPPDLSCRSPRIIVTNKSTQLLWISNATGGAHAGTAAIHSLDITTTVDPANARVVVDRVWTPKDGEFPGLYCDPVFVQSPFLRLRNTEQGSLVLHSTWGSTTRVLLISVDNGEVKDLTKNSGDDLFNWTVLNTDGGRRILCSRSSITKPYELVVGEVNDSGTVSWRVVYTTPVSSKISESLSCLAVEIIPIPNRAPTETILVKNLNSKASAKDKVLPLILFPHGGPHGATHTGFNPAVAAWALEGYNISMPNYTGSTGYGETHIQALIGKCGTLDVGDCIESVRHLVKLGIAEEGPGKIFITGGSHGGFLTGHLIGQYSDVFTAAALRNPVTSAEISTSDIPDWYYSEFGIDYPMQSKPLGSDGTESSSASFNVPPPLLMTPDFYKRLFLASPMSYVEKVKVPVLLLLGGSDARVAPTQGVEYYHALKAVKRKEGKADDVELLWFPEESHPLEGVIASKVSWFKTVEWFKRK